MRSAGAALLLAAGGSAEARTPEEYAGTAKRDPWVHLDPFREAVLLALGSCLVVFIRGEKFGSGALAQVFSALIPINSRTTCRSSKGLTVSANS